MPQSACPTPIHVAIRWCEQCHPLSLSCLHLASSEKHREMNFNIPDLKKQSVSVSHWRKPWIKPYLQDELYLASSVSNSCISVDCLLNFINGHLINMVCQHMLSKNRLKCFHSAHYKSQGKQTIQPQRRIKQEGSFCKFQAKKWPLWRNILIIWCIAWASIHIHWVVARAGKRSAEKHMRI